MAGDYKDPLDHEPTIAVENLLRIGDLEHCTPVVWVVCIGVGFSLALFFAMRWWDRQNVEKAFRLAAKDRTTAVKSLRDRIGHAGTDSHLVD